MLFRSVHSPSRVRLFATPWTAARQAPLSFTISWSLLKLMSIESVMPSNHLILCHPLLLLPSIFPSIRVFPNELALPIKWPKYWSFSFSISPFNEYSGLVSFRIDWFDLLVVQETLKSLLQYHIESISSSVLSLLYGPALTPIHDSSKKHGFDYTEFCQQSNVSNLTAVQVCHSFPSKEQVSFNFIAAGTICSDFGTQENLSLLPHFPLLFARK